MLGFNMFSKKLYPVFPFINLWCKLHNLKRIRQSTVINKSKEQFWADVIFKKSIVILPKFLIKLFLWHLKDIGKVLDKHSGGRYSINCVTAEKVSVEIHVTFEEGGTQNRFSDEVLVLKNTQVHSEAVFQICGTSSDKKMLNKPVKFTRIWRKYRMVYEKLCRPCKLYTASTWVTSQ